MALECSFATFTPFLANAALIHFLIGWNLNDFHHQNYGSLIHLLLSFIPQYFWRWFQTM
jgi:hypothetical protein